jgi:hypothetical protein
MRGALVLTILVGLLLVCGGSAYWAWQELGDVEIGTNGLIALGLGVVMTFALGAGLMALMFYSARRGYDERAHEADQTHADHWRRPPDQD